MTSSVRTVTLISVDGNEFEIPVDAATQSNLIKNMLDDVAVSGKVPLSNMNSTTLAKFTEYCRKHADPEVTEEELKKWDSDFLKWTMNCCLILFSSELYGHQKLVRFTLSRCGCFDEQKTTEQIRQAFNIKNDFTPEEEEENRKENSWAFEN